MSIIRSPRPDANFYVLDKSISEDETLSWAARGLLVFLLGKPDNWRISVEHLKRQTVNSAKPTGRDGIYSLLMELMNAGYIRRTAARDDMGKMAGYDYFVSENRLFASPRTHEPVTDSPCPAEPYTAETTLISIEDKQELNLTNSCPQQADDGCKFRFADIRDAYNRICAPTLPACRADTAVRKAQVKKMVDLEFNGKKPFREHGIAMWESYFRDCLTNKHWCGENDRGWRADFDFVTNTKNAIKLLERICG